jgi:SAM-dependent methyltransferase
MLSITSFINHSKFGLVNFLLLPFSAIFFIFSYIRLCLYKVRLLKVSVSSVPVIVIGNITAGGTGKTPIVIAVANYFASRNKMVGVVSRGYGGKYAQESLEVTSTSDPIDCGDEPLLIKQQTQAFVVVAKKRSNAVKFLTENYSVDLIISPHIIEQTFNAELFFNELYRVIIPGGYAVFVSFNPYSFAGLRKVFGFENIAPWNGNFISPNSVQKSLISAGFTIEQAKISNYQIIFNNEVMNFKESFESIGARWLPLFGNIYFISAKKIESSVTPIKPKWIRTKKLSIVINKGNL